jgi:prephenate dehydrogenase
LKVDEFESFDSSREIGVIGCGMIGGSIALSLSKSGHHVSVLDLPQNERAILRQIPSVMVMKDLGNILRERPKVIFVCVPSEKSVEIIKNVAASASAGTIITDVAGVKKPVMDAVRKFIPKNVVFVGGHPMAGTERSGVEAAQPFLFQNAVYVLSPLRNYPELMLLPLLEAIDQLGARILFMDAAEHDKIAAATSHLPQLLAVELVNLLNKLSERDENFNVLAAGGFRDMTRIASSDFAVWKDVVWSNRANIDVLINALVKRLTSLRRSISEGRMKLIEREFENARYGRSRIRKGGKGFLRPLYDLYVVVEDKVGVLKDITTTLADSCINIKDIELLKVREGTGGMFRLSFDTEQIMDRAAQILEQKGFEILRKEYEG